MLKKLLKNSHDSINNADFVKLKRLKEKMEENQSLFNSTDLITYLYLQSILMKNSSKAIPDRKIKSFVENLNNVAEKIGFDFDTEISDTKSIYNLSSIKLATAIQKHLHTQNVENIKLIDYSSSRNGSHLLLLIDDKDTVSVDIKKLGCDSYLTSDLLDTLWDKDITPLWNLDEKNKIILIDNIIEELISSIDDEIAKLTIKSKLSRLVDTKINLDDIKTHFMESLVKLEQDNLNDGALKDIYSQKFYKQLTGNRDEDNRISFEIIKNIKRKSPDEDLAMIFFDVNNFKTLNDEYSHNVGDEMLKHISGQLLSDVSSKGIVSRRGGDEFVVIAPISLAKEIVEKEFSKERIEENNRIFNRIIGTNNNKTNISLTCGIKKIPNNINEKNCSLILHKCDIYSDARGLEHKLIPHYLNGSSRGEIVSNEEYNEAKIKLIKNLYDELGITEINIWGEENLTLSNDVIKLNNKDLQSKIDDLQLKNMAESGKYLIEIDKETNTELTKRRKNALSLK